MQEIIAATNNKNKLKEIREILKGYTVFSLSDVGIECDPAEIGKTFVENALIKARAVYELTHKATIADDSGIVTNALNGMPGIFSARFAGTHGDDKRNNDKLLNELKDKRDRSAYFMSAVALVCDKGEFVATGRTDGEIMEEAKGDGGFGYDPLFYSYELKTGFGQATAEQKNMVSHRGKALRNLLKIIEDENL